MWFDKMMHFGPRQNNSDNAPADKKSAPTDKKNPDHDSSFIEGIDHNDQFLEYRADKTIELIKEMVGKKVNEKFVKDLYSGAYLPVPIMKSETNDDQKSIFYQTLKTLFGDDLFAQAKLDTTADPASSCELAANFVANLIKRLTETKNSASAGYTEKNNAEQILKLLLQEGGTDTEELKEALRRHDKEAIGHSAKELGENGAGRKAGKGHSLDFEDKVKAIDELSEREDILEVLEELNKIPGINPQNLDDNKNLSSSGMDRSLEKGSDLSRVAATELALPKDIFEYMFATESLVINKQHRNVNNKSPIYLLIDKSISMEKVMDIAKATALALYKKSALEGREFNVMFFDDHPHETYRITGESSPENITKTFDYICNVKDSGGTSIKNALADVCESIMRNDPSKEWCANIILITDGEDTVNPSEVSEMLKNANANIISILIEKYNQILQGISKTCFYAHMEHENISITKIDNQLRTEDTIEQLYFDM